jgi:uncharacterized membrane protein YfcA
VLIYLIAFAGGLLAGVINTLAGNGSAITLTILTELMGLPPNVANGTNRIGVLANSVAASTSLYTNGKLELNSNRIMLGLLLLGAMFGLWAALRISNEDFRFVFAILLVIMLCTILLGPSRWIKERADTPPAPPWVLWPLYFALGFYGGFIQMGMGIFFLAITVLLGKLPLAKANALKVFSTALYTAVVLAVFASQHMVAWREGLILAAGQGLGGWLGGSFVAKHPKSGIVTYWLLVAVVAIVVVRMAWVHF